MIQLESVTKNFADVRSLNNVSLSVPDGSIFGLIGSNGSGKSTLLRVMCGVIAPDGGRVLSDGFRVWENPDVKEKIVYLSDEPFFLPHASLSDMRALYASLYPAFDVMRYGELLSLFGLDERRRIATFSKGMQKQAAVLLALSVRPRLLLCDETFDGLDPVMRQLVKRILAEEVAADNATVVIASHNLREIEDICDRVALLHRGELLFTRELDDMKLCLQKVQAILPEERGEVSLGAVPLLSCVRRGSMVTLVARGTREEVEAAVAALRPTFCEFIPLTLEEIFISEMGDRGYDFSKLIG